MNPATITARDIRFSQATLSDAAAGLDTLLVTLITWIRRYVVVTDVQAVAIGLWTAHTHTLDAFDCTPYLQITSATKRAGKTRLLEVLEPIVARPWLTGRTSAAALVRKIDAQSPTLLLDESDAAFGGEREYAEALRGILNSGYRRSGKATVCIGQGANITARDFSTFSSKAIAGIGVFPDTVADRSIKIQLRRRMTDERCDRWRERDGHQEAAPLYARLATWAATAIEHLRAARPAIPSSLGDRAADCWEPLFAISDLAGGSWPSRARSAAIAMAGSVEDQDISIELLHDIYTVFDAGALTFITSKQLVEQLVEMDDRPWVEWRLGKPITPRAIADRLKTFGIIPKPNATGSARGYYRDRFEDAWTRYSALKPSNRPEPNEYGPESHISKRHGAPQVDASKTAEPPMNTGLLDGLTLQEGETHTGGYNGDF